MVEGTVILGEENHKIIKIKVKAIKKSSSTNYEFIPENTQVIKFKAQFIQYPKEENGATKNYQFYLSNSNTELSFDLHD